MHSESASLPARDSIEIGRWVVSQFEFTGYTWSLPLGRPSTRMLDRVRFCLTDREVEGIAGSWLG